MRLQVVSVDEEGFMCESLTNGPIKNTKGVYIGNEEVSKKGKNQNFDFDKNIICTYKDFEDFSEIDINNLTCYKIVKELINLAKNLYFGEELLMDFQKIVTNNKAKILDFNPSKRNNHKRLVMKPKDKIDN